MAVGRPEKRLLHLPLWWGRVLASTFERMARLGWLPSPPLTRDQLKSLSSDNAADTSETIQVFGGEWGSLPPGIREYLDPFRRHDPKFGLGGRFATSAENVLDESQFLGLRSSP